MAKPRPTFAMVIERRCGRRRSVDSYTFGELRQLFSPHELGMLAQELPVVRVGLSLGGREETTTYRQIITIEQPKLF